MKRCPQLGSPRNPGSTERSTDSLRVASLPKAEGLRAVAQLQALQVHQVVELPSSLEATCNILNSSTRAELLPFVTCTCDQPCFAGALWLGYFAGCRLNDSCVEDSVIKKPGMPHVWDGNELVRDQKHATSSPGFRGPTACHLANSTSASPTIKCC